MDNVQHLKLGSQMSGALITKYVLSHNKKWRKMKTCLSYKDLQGPWIFTISCTYCNYLAK